MASASSLWIKICATTNLADALLAADLGADAIGFVFAPSPRQVTAEQVAAITPHLPLNIERVGVFPTSTHNQIPDIALAAKTAGLTTIQLHGSIDLPFAASLQESLGPGFTLIQTSHWIIGPDQRQSAAHVTAQLNSLASISNPRVLVDAKLGAESGGLGVSFDWPNARHVFQSHSTLRLIVAGGLRPDNVAEAIAQLNPYGVDVASGVEQMPGKKDPEKLRAFMKRAREAN